MKNMKTILKGALALVLVALTTNTWATSLTVESRPNTVNGVWVTKSENNPPSEDAYTNKDKSEKTGLGTLKFWAYYKTANEEWDFLGWFDNEAGSGTALSTTAWPYQHGVKAGNNATIYGHFHVHDFSLYETSDLTITRQCANADEKCKHAYTAKTATLVAADSKAYDGEPYVATKTGTGADDATITYWKGESQIESAVEAGSYTVKMTYGTATVSKPFSILAHTHNFSCEVSEGKLTVTCQNEGCTIPGGTSLEIVCEGKTYDGQPLTATIKDNTPSPDTFESYTSGTRDAEVTWDDSTAKAGAHKASFKATVAGEEYTVTKTITISPADIAGKTLTLSPTSTSYTGAGQTVSVTVDGLTKDVDYTISGDALTQVGSGAANKTYTVTVNGIGNYTGSKSAQWTIIAPTGSLGSMAAVGNGCSKDGDTAVKVTASQSLAYDATAKTWSFGLKVDVPNSIPTWEEPTVTYPDNMIITTSCDKVTTSMETDTDSWWTKGYTYVKSVSATAKFTLDDILAAEAAGELKFTVSIGAKAGEYNSAGLKEVIYELVVPIDENLILLDEDKNQAYPVLNFVAQVADTKLKYTTLGAALGATTAGQTVNALAACEAGTFEIGQNVTVNLAGFGNAEAAYKFVNVTDEAMSAKVVSTKEENVTTEVTGFGVQNDNYTYTLYRAHQHLWEAATSGATLTATCTNMTTDCDIVGRSTAITLTVTDNGDGNAPTFTIDNKDDFLSKVNKFGEVAVIGSVTAVRNTDDGAETTKWYIGNYTASCIVTVNGEEKTITQDFQIGGALKDGGYSTSVGGLTIRYETFGEALTAAEAGSTVYYRGGDVSSEDEQTLAFANVNKDITLDFGGKTFWYRGNADAYVTMSGTGTLTLQNIVLQQPRDKPTIGSYSYNDIVFSGGSFILGNGVNGASTDTKKLALKVVNASVEVQAGLYKCSLWAGDNGSVTIKGGEYWSNFNPASYVANGYVTVAATTSDYTYKVVPHTHNFYYVTDGNVITLRCQGAGYEGCDWTLNDNKLTLTANDAFEGATYTGASYTYDDSFVFDGDDPAIEYYQDGKKIATPSDYGSYEARVTVTINEHGATATAVKAFTIKHVHQFKYDIAPAATLTATCTNAVSTCDIEGHSTAITLTVTPNGDGNAPTFAIENKDAFLGFVNRDATVASIGEITTVRNTDDGAAVTKWYVGDYTSTCIVTISGVEYALTANFSIAKPEGGYTSGWTVGSRDIRYDSWEEAQAIFVDGDTIYYRDGNRDYTEHKFSIGAKSLTLDFCGATLKQASSISGMTIKNDGTGTLILQNVTIQQPKYLGISYQVSTEGNIVFGEGVKATNQADNPDRYLTITVNSDTLIVSNGLYQCGFATKSETETVNLRAGKYWENDKPAIGQYSLADRVCIEIEGDYKYEIVPHVHSFTYTAEGNVITSVCDGEYKEGCYWYQNPQTATLTANDAAESTEPYAGVSVAYSDLWAGSKELAITYWQGETQLEGAPTRFGSYTAKITVGGATAEKSFTITPMAVTITVQNATNATVKVYEGDTEVTSQTEEYSVTHGNKVTAIYTADEGYTPAAVTNVIESAENGDTIMAPIFKKAGPTIVPPTGSDPETDPEIKPVEGTNGVYVIEVKTNTTTAVMIDGLGADDTVIVPPQINAVNGANADQVKVVADATNGTATVKVDITPAFTITDNDNGVIIELNSNAVVTVEIEGKEPEQVPVTPVLTEATDPVKPLVVSDEKIATGVKTIPGLKYSLLSGDAPDTIETVVKIIVAEDTRVVLEAAKGADPAKFYKIQVTK